MVDINRISECLVGLQPLTIDSAFCARLVRLIDLTSLKDTDTPATIVALCDKAETPYGVVAGVCVAPTFVPLVSNRFQGSTVKTVTVANFPAGDSPLESVLAGINESLLNGAQEIDVVFPYARYLSGDRAYGRSFIEACRAACGDAVTLKVILETGMIQALPLIAEIGQVALEAGADFLKTSTGMTPMGATMESALVLLQLLREFQQAWHRPAGIKISGGVRTLDQAAAYLALADAVMGKAWVSPQTYRIGASQLIDEIIQRASKPC